MQRIRSVKRADYTRPPASTLSTLSTSGFTETPVSGVRELGSLSGANTREVRELTKFVGSKDADVGESVKENTVLTLIRSARGSRKQRIDDIKFLGEMGVRFQPIDTAQGMLTQKDAHIFLGIGRTTLPPIFEDEASRGRWRAVRVNPRRWRIPANTVNRANVELKSSVSFSELYRLLREKGVRKEYDNFKEIFVSPPDDMGEADRKVLLEARAEKPFLDDIYGGHKGFTDVTSAAVVARYLLAQKELLAGGYSTEAAGSLFGVTSHHVSLLHRRGRLPATTVRGGAVGGIRLRLSGDELRQTLSDRRRASTGYSTKEAAEELGLSARHITKLLRDGRINANRVPGFGTGGNVWRFSGRQLEDARRALGGEEAALIKELKALKPDKSHAKMTVRYRPDVLEGDYMGAQDRFKEYKGPENVPKEVWTKLNEKGITYEPMTGEELKRSLIADTLLERYGTIEGVSKNISRHGLAKLDFEITHEDDVWRMTAIKHKTTKTR